MQKKVKFDQDAAFKSIIGVGAEDEAQNEAVKEEVTHGEDDTQMPLTAEPKAEPKKRGRKKLENREKKARYSFTVLPSVYEQAQKKAEQEGKTLSELVSEFLLKYGK